MKIECITNEKDFLKKSKIYIVYSFYAYQESNYYCICDEYFTFYPRWRSIDLFKIVDNRLSRYWVFGLRQAQEEEKIKKVPLLSFPEWINDDYFYNELIDGNGDDPNAIIFKKYKQLMDLEFPDPSITKIAQIGDEEWLICPDCIDTWNSKNSQDALVRCPKCQQILNNPRYKNVWPYL